MGTELDTKFLLFTNLNTGEPFKLETCDSLVLNQEELSDNISFKETSSFSASGSINKDSIDKLIESSNPYTKFIVEGTTGVLIQARWHKKARIRKKWLKRYGYKESVVKIFGAVKEGSVNTEAGEINMDIDNIEYGWKPNQLRKGLDIKRVLI